MEIFFGLLKPSNLVYLPSFGFKGLGLGSWVCSKCWGFRTLVELTACGSTRYVCFFAYQAGFNVYPAVQMHGMGQLATRWALCLRVHEPTYRMICPTPYSNSQGLDIAGSGETFT